MLCALIVLAIVAVVVLVSVNSTVKSAAKGVDALAKDVEKNGERSKFVRFVKKLDELGKRKL